MSATADQTLRDWFNSTSLPPDGRIPAERVLAAELGLSRAELRKALARLEQDGRLLRHVGRGSFLRPSEDGFEIGGGARKAVLDMAGNASPRDLARARLALEPVLAGLAAQDATGLQVAAMLRSVPGLDDPLPQDRDASYGEMEDAAFHRAVAEATRNPVLLAAYDRIADARRLIGWGRLAERLAEPQSCRGANADHRTIATTIADRDRLGAETAMRHHLLVEATVLFGAGP